MEFEDLLAYCRANRRVCPMPILWQDLWKLLPGRRRVDGGWSPPLPLVLAAWETTTDEQKRERLATHLEWARDHRVLPRVAALILSLKDEDWRTELGDWGASVPWDRPG
jgi:hypothetical protein